jgi:hypothetical protein
VTDRFQEHLEERRSQNYASTRLWTADPHKLGMIGERTLAEFFGAEPDLRNKPFGDSGVDIELLFRRQDGGEQWVPVDAKGSSYGDWLRVDTKIIKPKTLYVLVLVSGDVGRCIGWASGARLMKEPTLNWCENGTWVHALQELQPMESLLERYLGQWRHDGLDPRPAAQLNPKTAPIPQPSNAYYDGEGHLLHYCACGQWGAFGYGVDLRKGRLGIWYCGACRPPTSNSR